MSKLLGAAVRGLRKRRELTQSGLAMLAGLSRASIAVIEAGESDPRLSTLESLAEALEVSVSELLSVRMRTEAELAAIAAEPVSAWETAG